MRVSSNSTFTLEEAGVFGKEMRRLRKESGLKVKELAELVGVSDNYVSNIESPSKNKKPSPQLAERIANVFDTTVEQMLNPKTNDDRVWEFRRNYGATLKEHREAKGLPSKVLAGAVGVPTQVYREWEQGLCSITDMQMAMLDRLLGIGEKPKVVAETKIVETPAEVPSEICDIILRHIKDLGDDVNEQKKVWRYFTDMRIAAEERELFG